MSSTTLNPDISNPLPLTSTTNSDEPVYGLTYPPTLLPSLRLLTPRPSPHQPIRLLPLSTFTSLHLQSTLNHAPDGVLFPFLHGLEGRNEAQNMFFATGSTRGVGGAGKAPLASVPRFRGLVWVVCEEDMIEEPVGAEYEDMEDLEDDFYSSEDEEELMEDVDLDLGLGAGRDTFAMDVDEEPGSERLDKDKDAEGHMHPVHHRAVLTTTPTSSPTTTTTTPHDRRDSTASIASTATTSSYATSASEDDTHSISTTATSLFLGTASAPSSPLSEGCPTAIPAPIPSPPNTAIPAQKKREEPAPRKGPPPLLTSTFRPKDLLRTNMDGEPEFAPPRVPDGISLRNFGIQVPIYATLSDIVIYSPKGLTRAAMALAERFKVAVEKKAGERRESMRLARGGSPLARGDGSVEGNGNGEEEELIKYNVFVLDATTEEMEAQIPHLMVRLQPSSPSSTHTHTDGTDGHTEAEPEPDTQLKPNTIDFAQREKEEMRDLTKASEIISIGGGEKDLSGTTTASHWDSIIGQIFLGNSNDVPLVPPFPPPSPPLSPSSPSPETEKEREARIAAQVALDDPFLFRPTNDPAKGLGYDVCVECHEMAPFPSAAHLRAAEEHLAMLDLLWGERCGEREHEGDGEPSTKVRPPPNANAIIHLPFPSSPASTAANVALLLPFVKFLERLVQPVQPPQPSPPPPSTTTTTNTSGAQGTQGRRWSSVSSLFPSSGYQTSRTRSSTTSTFPAPAPTPKRTARTRPLKILIYSSDGYTESSVPALCLLMALRGLSLPEAYLELQVVKRRSFFVYQSDLGVLRRVEGRLGGERAGGGVVGVGGGGRQGGWGRPAYHSGGRPAANSISIPSPSPGPNANSFSVFPMPPPMMIVPSQSPSTLSHSPSSNAIVKSRPRASTSPWLPSLFDDHSTWFSDPRFDGSFPSRVLPFLYLGNLNHATNAYMLHALGITHVVSVGECALVPPQGGGGAHFVAGKGPGGQGSLWIEEREGRIKVLDIKGVCDDGIDTLEPQLEPICDWIEKARKEGGQVLVHCRVGVSRSATVTIAYVMKHLALPLVDAYLIVRSRRLSVLIQPNMRLLYNLCGWEVKLARERAGEDEGRLKNELARTLSWPYLAREVHALNEKYLH